MKRVKDKTLNLIAGAGIMASGLGVLHGAKAYDDIHGILLDNKVPPAEIQKIENLESEQMTTEGSVPMLGMGVTWASLAYQYGRKNGKNEKKER